MIVGIILDIFTKIMMLRDTQSGISRSGYNSRKNRITSSREQRKNIIKNKICDIYDESHQNYDAPKITNKLKEEGETISEKTIGNYMREMGLKAQWSKHYTVTTIDSDFSSDRYNYVPPNDYEKNYWIKLKYLEINVA